MIIPTSYDRYHRQMILKDFGVLAQQKLLGAKVLVIGAGGLGCPALVIPCRCRYWQHRHY